MPNGMNPISSFNPPSPVVNPQQHAETALTDMLRNTQCDAEIIHSINRVLSSSDRMEDRTVEAIQKNFDKYLDTEEPKYYPEDLQPVIEELHSLGMLQQDHSQDMLMRVLQYNLTEVLIIISNFPGGDDLTVKEALSDIFAEQGETTGELSEENGASREADKVRRMAEFLIALDEVKDKDGVSLLGQLELDDFRTMAEKADSSSIEIAEALLNKDFLDGKNFPDIVQKLEEDSEKGKRVTEFLRASDAASVNIECKEDLQIILKHAEAGSDQTLTALLKQKRLQPDGIYRIGNSFRAGVLDFRTALQEVAPDVLEHLSIEATRTIFQKAGANFIPLVEALRNQNVLNNDQLIRLVWHPRNQVRGNYAEIFACLRSQGLDPACLDALQTIARGQDNLLPPDVSPGFFEAFKARSLFNEQSINALVAVGAENISFVLYISCIALPKTDDLATNTTNFVRLCQHWQTFNVNRPYINLSQTVYEEPLWDQESFDDVMLLCDRASSDEEAAGIVTNHLSRLRNLPR